VPVGDALTLEILRWPNEILDPAEFELPQSSKKLGVSEKEISLAKRLIDDMTEKWQPDKYRDTYRAQLEEQIERRVKEGKTEVVTQAPREGKAAGGAQVIDLMAALQRSLEGKSKPARKRAGGEEEAATPRKRAASRASSSHRASHARKRA
jgi:DNA end-binding protein Ku